MLISKLPIYCRTVPLIPQPVTTLPTHFHCPMFQCFSMFFLLLQYRGGGRAAMQLDSTYFFQYIVFPAVLSTFPLPPPPPHTFLQLFFKCIFFLPAVLLSRSLSHCSVGCINIKHFVYMVYPPPITVFIWWKTIYESCVYVLIYCNSNFLIFNF